VNTFAKLGIGLLLILSITAVTLVLQIMGIGKEKLIMPDVTIQSLNGKPLTLSDLEAKARVIHIFSTNRHELGLLSQALKSAKYQNIDYLFIAVQSNEESVIQDALQFGISQDLIFLDDNAEVASALGYASLPNSLFINSQNTLLKNRASIDRPENLESDLKSILK